MTARHTVPLIALWAIVFTSLLPGCSGESPATSGDATADAQPTPSDTSTSPAPHFDRERPVVRIETNVGAITVQLDAVESPGTVRNFLSYARDGFYDNTLVHYVDPGNLLVAGGYSTDRQPKPARLPIRNEAHNGLKNLRGTIAMTRIPERVDSATSQFFINLKDAPQRDHQSDAAEDYGYCVFGEVIEGLEIAERISQAATTDLGGDLAQTPDPQVAILSVRVVR
jgi:cyclophilin family peptidyl-prolyl cis-trans isomerase